MFSRFSAWLTRKRQDEYIATLLQEPVEIEGEQRSRDAWFDFPTSAQNLPKYRMTAQPLVIVVLLVLAFLLIPHGGAGGLASSIKESATSVTNAPRDPVLDGIVMLWLIVGGCALVVLALLFRESGWKGILYWVMILGMVVVGIPLMFLGASFLQSWAHRTSWILSMSIGLIVQTAIFAYVFAYLSELVVRCSRRTDAKNYGNYLGLLFLFGFAISFWHSFLALPFLEGSPRLLQWISMAIGLCVAPLFIPRAKASIARDVVE